MVHFLDSPDGIEFLHHLHVALHLVFGQANDCGLRALSSFLKLSGLDEFLPASYGALQAFAVHLEASLAEYGQQQEQQLAANMPPREITLCEDETFHPQICLVAIEPVSNYLLLEQYAAARDANTWHQAIAPRLASWSITVMQVTSDEAAALIAHAEQHLGAHHSPDLFHVQQETVKATSLALAGQTRRACQAVIDAEQTTAKLCAEQAACQEQCPLTTHVAELQRQIEQAVAAEAEAQQQRAACQQRQQQATETRQALSHDYHPIDLETGQPLEAEEVSRRLSGHFDRLDEIAKEAGLSESARERLAKARRVFARDGRHDRVLLEDGGTAAGVEELAAGGEYLATRATDSGSLSEDGGGQSVDCGPARATAGAGRRSVGACPLAGRRVGAVERRRARNSGRLGSRMCGRVSAEQFVC